MANPKLDAIRTKFSTYVQEVEKMQEALHSAHNQVNELEKLVAQKEAEVSQLKDQLSERNIAQAMVGSNAETNQAKQKIAELMREIDRCIALLNV